MKNATRTKGGKLPDLKHIRDGEIVSAPTNKKERLLSLDKDFPNEQLEHALSLLLQIKTSASFQNGVAMNEIRGLDSKDVSIICINVNFVYENMSRAPELRSPLCGNVIYRGSMRATPDENGTPKYMEHTLLVGQEWELAVSEIKEVLANRASKKATYANRPKTFTVHFQKEQSRFYYPEQKKYCGLASNQCALIDLIKDKSLTGSNALHAMKDCGESSYQDVTALAHGVHAINKKILAEFGIQDFILNRGGYSINPVVKMK